MNHNPSMIGVLRVTSYIEAVRQGFLFCILTVIQNSQSDRHVASDSQKHGDKCKLLNFMSVTDHIAWQYVFLQILG